MVRIPSGLSWAKRNMFTYPTRTILEETSEPYRKRMPADIMRLIRLRKNVPAWFRS